MTVLVHLLYSQVKCRHSPRTFTSPLYLLIIFSARAWDLSVVHSNDLTPTILTSYFDHISSIMSGWTMVRLLVHDWLLWIPRYNRIVCCLAIWMQWTQYVHLYLSCSSSCTHHFIYNPSRTVTRGWKNNIGLENALTSGTLGCFIPDTRNDFDPRRAWAVMRRTPSPGWVTCFLLFRPGRNTLERRFP